MNHDARIIPVLDLFAGIGGFTRAFEAVADAEGAGRREQSRGEQNTEERKRGRVQQSDGGSAFRTIGFSEIDPYACAVLAHRFPGVPNFGPVQNVTRDSVLERAGCLPVVVTGGFPCQPHSVAGKRESSEDERDLWHECARILCELRPRFALFENVGGLLTSEDDSGNGERAGGLFLNRIMSDLSAIRYACLWQVVPASAVGAPHRRDRLWLLCVDELADSDGEGLEGWSESRQPGRTRGTKPNDEQPMRCGGDGHETLWPARPGCEQFAWEPPRVVGNTDKGGLRRAGAQGSEGHVAQSDEGAQHRQAKPDMGRDTHGLPDGMDATANRVSRLKALGNSIVPQVAEIFARAILSQL